MFFALIFVTPSRFFNSLLTVSSFLKMFVLALASRRGSNNYEVLLFPQLLFPQP